MSETDCPDCARAELPRRKRLAAAALDLVFPPRPSPFAGLSGVIRAMTGAPEPTWYEKHRATWEQSGDADEIERMLRHVSDAS